MSDLKYLHSAGQFAVIEAADSKRGKKKPFVVVDVSAENFRLCRAATLEAAAIKADAYLAAAVA